jgi:hypothetical protein
MSRAAKPPERALTDPVTKKDFDALTDTIDRWRVKTQSMVERHDEQLQEASLQLQEQHHALFGNGTPGMDEQIRNLTKGMDVLVRLGWIVAGSVVTLTLSGIVWAAVYIIRNSK